MENKYTARRCEKGDVCDVKNLIKEVFGVERTRGYIQWKYFASPAGKTLSAVVFSNGKLVAFLGAIPIRFSVDGQESVGVQEVDVGILEDHRNLAVYLNLVNQEKNALLTDNVDFTYGITVKNTSQLNQELFGKKKICPIPRLVKILDVKPFLEEKLFSVKISKPLAMVVNAALGMRFAEKVVIPKGMQLTRIDHFDARFETFWQRIKSDYPIMPVKDPAYLNWRYADTPHADIEIICLEQSESREVIGFIVLGLRKEEMLKGSLYEFITPKSEDLSSAVCLLRYAIHRFRQNDATLIECWMFSHCHLYSALKKTGFISREKVGFDLSFQQIKRPNDNVSAAFVEKVNNWNISKGISDTD